MRRLVPLFLSLFLLLGASPAMAASDRFITMLRNGTTGQSWWDAPYLRQLPSGAEWVDGDRSGYKCMYAFLQYEGRIVGRVTFTRIPGAGYAAINDKYMVEGARHYDGRLASGAVQELGECNQGRASETYTPSSGPWQRPVIRYQTTGGKVLETRNYTTTAAGPGITFRQTAKTPQTVTVVAYEYGNPVIAVYYESMVPDVVMTSDM